ncbi:MAG: 30S ribosomal protein S8 [Candidatus Kerfeldbacteria bacterium RIFCSPHIGHO2_12_FULL_48_17]|uniref:Small ribosomal subunit protein uS8 n=1 Tax=Candidatus Kerfeldbacteria bacterium RIFCSPHIGHO2_12_FULL_48_17 TaxID=1798542 RepID=A0A1G2B7M0_9BACT|nr:MAG: 30S ribosomal protein S8 [Candidatus Kerfeldbacteria bacterium RIFCSPHIGHO2_12_FULL_48_17]
MFSDPIADMLTRIRNAGLSKKSEVMIPLSKMKYHLAEILVREGYVEHLEKNEKEHSFRVKLKYDENNKPHIRAINRLSTPGQRMYRDAKNLPVVLNGLGRAVISTSQGLMTNREAKKKSLGGEVICEIY